MNKTTIAIFKDIDKQLTKQKKQIAVIKNDILVLEKLITKLEKAGILNGSISYRDGKYAYFIEKMVDGQRERKYLGTDQELIQEYIQKIKNYDYWEQCHKTLAFHLSRIEDYHYELERMSISRSNY